MKNRFSSHVCLIRFLAPLTAIGLAACSGGGGGGGGGTSQAASCLDGPWTLSVEDLTSGGSCVDLGLDGAVVTLDRVPGAPSPPGSVSVPYFVSSSSVNVQAPGVDQTMMAAFYNEFDGSPLGLGTVRFAAFAGYMYLDQLDVTVHLTTGPTNDQFAQVSVTCGSSFRTFIDYDVYTGPPQVTGPDSDGFYQIEVPPTATLLCSGELRVDGAAGGNAPITSSPGIAEAAAGVLNLGGPDGAMIPLAGQLFDQGRGGVLAGRGELVVEFRRIADVEYAVRGMRYAGERLELEGSLVTDGSGLSGPVTYYPREGGRVNGQLVVRRTQN